MMRFQIKRVYAPAADTDGARILVDRLWPRGVKREALALTLWLKEAAPSDALRRWFGHEPARLIEFRQRYRSELDAHPEAVALLLDMVRDVPVTLLYAARDPSCNHALVLCEYLHERLPAG